MESVAVETPRGKIKSSGLERAATGIYIIWLRDFKRFWRDKIRRFTSFIQPLIYLLLLGTGLQAAFTVFGAGAKVKYVTFMFPGILAMTVLFTSVFSAISILWDREFGFLKEVLVSPVPRSSVAVGKVLGGATTACLQGAILMVLAFFPYFLGFSWDTLIKMVALIPILIILSFGLTAVGVAIAANLKSFEAFPLLMNLLLLPLFFLSGAMFPLQGLPGWMDFLTKINPLSYAVDMLRGISLKGIPITSLTSSTSAINSVISKIPKNVLSQIPPSVQLQLKDAITKAAASSAPQTPKLQIQVYPMWLSLLVVIGFGLLMLGVAIWQFTRQD
jgi:ABC-2 type transport system permease protein